jgi:hypothetical protein
MSMKLKTVTIADQEVEFHVEHDTGMFFAKVGDESYRAKTFEEVEAKATKAAHKLRDTQAVPVSVLNMIPRDKTARPSYDYESGPFTEGIGVVHAMLRGKSQHGDWMLAEGEKGKGPKFKLGGYRTGRQNLVRRLTAEEVEQYTHLATAVAQAEANLEAFRQAVHVEPEEALGLVDGAKRRA